MRKVPAVSWLLAVALAARTARGADHGEDALVAAMERLQSDVLQYRNEVERAYTDRCSSSTLNTCQNNNYNACSSRYPNQTCPSKEFDLVKKCGTGNRCNGLFDWSVSTVRLPRSLANGPRNNPTDTEVIETICYSRQTDAFLKKKFAETESFWADNGAYNHPTMYFGSYDGAFRIFPARQSEECGTYDPRTRPWFTASIPWLISNSTGGRDVVLIVDNSRSVGEVKKLELFQNTSKLVIQSLTDNDRIALVQFNEDAKVAGGYTTLVQATNDTKKEMMKAIDEMKPYGRTNYEIGFETGFKLLKESSGNGTNCNTAMIFVTDQEANYPAGTSAARVISLVEDEMATFSEANSTQIFTYSASKNNQMKTISCGIDGIWMGISNVTKAADIVEPYYSFYTASLGDNPANENFTAWVGPYAFATGGQTGITSSALVYDREINPAKFIGAVGADLTVEKIKEILGFDGEEDVNKAVQQAMNKLRQTPNVTCPVRLEGCSLEAARYWTGGYPSMCDASCKNDTGVLPLECSGKDEYPNDMWNNVKLDGYTYQERTCCRIGESEPSKDCPNVDLYGEPRLSKMQIFGIICGIIIFLEIIACVYWQSGFSFLKCLKCERSKSASRS